MMGNARVILPNNANMSGVSATSVALRAWGSAVSGLFATAGLVKASDTGQVDWTTVVADTSSGAKTIGNEVWRFNDTLQATAPVFLVVKYVTSTSGVGSILTFVCMATDGACTPIGIYQADNPFSTGSAWSLSYPTYVFGDGSSIVIVFGFGETSAKAMQGLLVVSRTQDGDGAYNANGYFRYSSWQPNTSASVSFGAYSYATNAMMSASGGQGAITSAATSSISGDEVNLFPWVIMTPGVQGAPTCLYSVYVGDFSKGSIITYNGRTYICLGNQALWSGGASSSAALAVRCA